MSKIVQIFLFLLLIGLKTGNNQQPYRPTVPLDTSVFPYSFVNDDLSHHYTYYRAEGDNPRQILCHFFKYLRKYKNKKIYSSSSEIDYFKKQQQIIDWFLDDKIDKFSGDKVKIGLVGDLMWIRNNWSDFVDKELLAEMQQSDIWIGNLETPIDKNKKVKQLFPDYLRYNSDSALITSFIDKNNTSLFKVLSIGNNHIMDKGEEGIHETIDFLNRQNILYSGISKNENGKKFVTFIIKNIKFGFYAAGWGLNNSKALKNQEMKFNMVNGIAPIGEGKPDLNEIKMVLEEMREEKVDFKIISLHWGAEYEMYPDPQQVIMAREIVKSGADLILGQHSHVIQGFEIYFLNGYENKFQEEKSNESSQFIFQKLNDDSNHKRKALVLYSLGNFATEMFTEICQTGVMVGINVFRNEDNRVDWDFNSISKVINERNGAPKHLHKLKLKNQIK